MNYGWFVKLDNRAGHYGLLTVVAAGLFFLNLGGPTLWDIDEGKNANCAYEMMEAGDWIKPTFNAELRVDKPALLYWLQIFAYRLFGINEFAARLPSALASLLTLFVGYELGRRLFNKATGLLAGLTLATTPMLCAAARFANPDALLNLFTCLNLLIFWTGLQGRSRWWFIGLGATAGLAVMAKGPVGVLLPLAVMCLFLFWNGQLGVLWDRRWGLAFGTFFLVGLTWYILITVETKQDFVRGFFVTHHLHRFLSPMETHGHGPFFYVLILALGFAPWSAFLPMAGWPALLSALRRPWPRWRDAWHRVADCGAACQAAGSHGQVGNLPHEPYRFLWCWAGTFVVFYSASATKLPNYILPCAMPLAVIVARFWERWRTGTLAVAPWALRTAVVWLGFCGLLGTGAFFVLGGGVDVGFLRQWSVPGLAPWAALSVLPVLGSAVGLYLLKRQARTAFMTAMLGCVVLFMVPVVAWTLTAFNRVKAAHPLIELACAECPERDIRLACYELDYYPSLNFYSRRDVPLLKTEEDALDYFRPQPVPVYLFLPENHWQALHDKLPGPHRVIGRHRDLYRGIDVMVVTNH